MLVIWKGWLRAFARCARDESGNALVDYALVMTVLTLGMMVAVNFVGNTATQSATTDQQNMTSFQTKAGTSSP